MTTELYWMMLAVLMTALFWVPYVLDRYIVRGRRRGEHQHDSEPTHDRTVPPS